MIPPGNEKCNTAQSMILVQHGALPLFIQALSKPPPKAPQKAAAGSPSRDYSRLFAAVQLFCLILLYFQPGSLRRFSCNPAQSAL